MKVQSKLYCAYGKLSQAAINVYLVHNDQPTIVELYGSPVKGYWEIHGGSAYHVTKEKGNKLYTMNLEDNWKTGLDKVFDKGNFQKRLTLALKKLDKADWLEAEFSYQ